ncbi:MAG TPA: bifunctional DNA-formamidopyrimidine glycosylase/DNA-(apurinic or apyrimidinic site) lyase [Oligoflexus sp.]|uniref:bifunctional DNA-formamidopyrimidine glycosylase/DNA-(apurinic or apyrimidinic site) lyase n=1 Tax=Oligoflexus sp. TaxID=1971216 RepID=UPI002D372779|nr:bifunctional DNA-formamidopyrimidine glycosylase/DNA-(apurinic or apyrimidinic site) lyase [Oligoflexus sp.]HYX33542.1 bifunctional DNA-formamidopyrimidine glycosylase/DNA-(apurinic or apyrimidinic site) lyase [Oligoflexus sp.]
MPELPEVECLTRAVRSVILGKKLDDMVFHRPDLRWPIPMQDLRELIAGKTILSVERRSKYLLIETESGYAIIHLGMTGNMLFSAESIGSWNHTHASFRVIDDSGTLGYLHYVDPRRFGCILCSSRDALLQHPLLKDLGPEPLATEALDEILFERSRGKTVAVKNFLMDAHNVVGVGNIYANESLFLAGVKPSRKASSVKRDEWKKISDAIQSVLHAAIQAGGTSFRDYKHVDGEPGYFELSLSVYGRGGDPCLRCKTEISSSKIGGRATYFCRRCQR